MKREQKDEFGQATDYRMPEELNRVLEDARIKDISREAQSRYANIMYDISSETRRPCSICSVRVRKEILSSWRCSSSSRTISQYYDENVYPCR